MNNDVYIHSFQSVFPKYHLPQTELIDWILKAHKQSPIEDEDFFNRFFTRFCVSEKYISHRYFECGEVNENWDDHEIYKLTDETPKGATIGERNQFFSKTVQSVFENLYPESCPEHLIHVTCTGYVSPSPAQRYFSDKVNSPQITHSYHMGCYASLPSVRTAKAINKDTERDVDIVHTEMCSLHLNPSDHSPEQIVVQTLFADGHIKYSVGNSRKGLKILGIKEKLIPDSLDDMTWIPDSFGMRMTLSREVPLKIRDGIPDFVRELCEECDVRKEDILNDGIFAIHPGGPKIVEVVQQKLELRDDQISESKIVLYERGNMSSATLPHIWERILANPANKNKKVISLAFGPGLTIFGAIFEVH